MQEKECVFCKQVENAKQWRKKLKEKNNVNLYMKVRLQEYTVRKGHRCGVLEGAPVELNFCPVCGKKLKGVKK